MMNPLLILLSVVLTLFVFLKFIEAVHRKVKSVYRQYEMIKKVPGPPKENIILGNLKEFYLTQQSEIPNYLKTILDRDAGFSAQWLSCYSLVFIGKAEYAQHLFTSVNTSTKPDVIRFLHPVLGPQGLITINGEPWKQRRRLTTPTFHFSILSTYCDIFTDNSNRLIQKLRAYQPDTAVDVMEVMHLHALDNISEAAMGVKTDAFNHSADEYTKALKISGHSFAERLQRPWYWNDFLFFTFFNYGRKCNKASETIRDFTKNIVKLKLKERTQRQAENGYPVHEEYGTGKKRLAFLDHLLETLETQSVPFSDDDLLDQVKTFMGAGLETTGTSLGFTLHLLGIHSDIQEKCRKELDRIFDGSDRRPTMTDLQKMTYLDQVIKESLRLFPPVPILGRKVIGDTELGQKHLDQCLEQPNFDPLEDPIVDKVCGANTNLP